MTFGQSKNAIFALEKSKIYVIKIIFDALCYNSIVTLCYADYFPFLLRVRSWMLCAQWTCHVLQTRLSRVPLSHITCYRLMYLYVPFPVSRVPLCFFFWIVDLSLVTDLLYVSPFVSSTCLCLPLLLTLTRYSLSTCPSTS